MGLWSRFGWAFSPGCPTGTGQSGPMLVPVGPRTGTNAGPRGQFWLGVGGDPLVPVLNTNRDQCVPFFFWYLGFRVPPLPLAGSLSLVSPLAGAPYPSRRCPLSLSSVPPSSPPSSHRRRALHRFRTHIIRSTIYAVQVFNYMEIDHICSSSSEA